MNIIILALIALGPIKAEEAQLYKAAMKRLEVQSGEFSVVTHVLLQKKLPAYDGAEWDWHYWWTADKQLYRMDRHEISKARSEFIEELDHRGSRSFDGAVTRVIDSQVVPVPIQEYRQKGDWRPTMLFDPRLLGLSIRPMGIFRHVAFEDFMRVITNAESIETGRDAKGTFELYKHKEGLSYKYHFDDGGRPIDCELIGIKLPSGLRIRYEAAIEYGPGRGSPGDFPSKIDLVTYEGDVSDSHEVVEIRATNLNGAIDKSLCTWKSMGPRPGIRLRIDDDQNTPLYWDGEKFQPVPAGHVGGNLIPVAEKPPSPRQWLWIAAINALIFAGIIAYRLASKRLATSTDAIP